MTVLTRVYTVWYNKIAKRKFLSKFYKEELFMKPFKSHTAQLIKRSCKRFTAAVLVLLLIVMFIPSAIALGDDSPVLPDEDIPETLTRAQLEAHGAVARLRSEEPDEFTFVYLNEDGTRT